MGIETAERTFSFADLADFTALTEARGDLDIVDLLGHFAGLVRESLSAEDKLVEFIGDAVMLATRDPPRSSPSWPNCGLGAAAPGPRRPGRTAVRG